MENVKSITLKIFLVCIGIIFIAGLCFALFKGSVILKACGLNVPALLKRFTILPPM